ncbi:hypothetical protein SRHO_G00302900 [Serrasalmus rhombeus]
MAQNGEGEEARGSPRGCLCVAHAKKNKAQAKERMEISSAEQEMVDRPLRLAVTQLSKMSKPRVGDGDKATQPRVTAGRQMERIQNKHGFYHSCC